MTTQLDTLVDTIHEHIQDVMRLAIEADDYDMEDWAIQYYQQVLGFTRHYWEELQHE